MDKFYYCESSEQSVERSYEIIKERQENGHFDKMKINLPNEIIPMVIDEGDATKWA